MGFLLAALITLTNTAHAECAVTWTCFAEEMSVASCEYIDRSSSTITAALLSHYGNLEPVPKMEFRDYSGSIVRLRQHRLVAAPCYGPEHEWAKDKQFAPYDVVLSTQDVTYAFPGKKCSTFPRRKKISAWHMQNCCDHWPPSDMSCLFGFEKVDISSGREKAILATTTRMKPQPVKDPK